MMSEKAHIPRAGKFRKLAWYAKTAWRRGVAWRRRHDPELRELDVFRKCRRLEQTLSDYPRAVPLLTELMNAYRETGQGNRMLEVMRRLRDIAPKPVPDFLWDEQPPVKVWRNNIEAWCAKVEWLIKQMRLKVVHIQHVQNVLRISYDNATVVCDMLEDRGILGPYNSATRRRPVLMPVSR